MIYRIKQFVKRICRGYRASSELYVEHLKKIGVSIGAGVEFFNPELMHVDEQNPHLLSIGSYVQMTGPVTILTHDYSWSVLKGRSGTVLGNQKPVDIGNNIFIGWGATILAGSIIEDNVIVGAHSVVSGKCEKDSVYAGVPAKKICTIDEYRTKREKVQEIEAIEFAKKYYERFGKLPSMEHFHEYFYLFTRSDSVEEDFFAYKLKLMGSEALSKEYIAKNISKYESFDAFISRVKEEIITPESCEGV